ncbi:MAG: amino acid adenylation domain-containing protein [Gemmatimonadales bacterium]
MADHPPRDARQQLLERLLASEGLDQGGAAGIGRRPPGSEAPQSYAQEVLWLLDRATPGMVAYNSALAWRLSGPVDSGALRQAVQRLMERHEALRTRFATREDRNIQVADPLGNVVLAEEDLRSLSDHESRIEARLQDHARRPFDLERDHLFRPVLLRLADDDAVLLLVTHHIVSDAWSYGILVRELAALYAAALRGEDASLPALPIQFGDYAAWERAELAGERLAGRIAWWREHLLPPADDLEVPSDRPGTGARGERGAKVTRSLDPGAQAALKALAAEQGATLYMVCLAAFKAVLARWSGQSDIVVGSAVAGRTRRETEGVVGYFSGALPLRTRMPPSGNFVDLLRAVRSTCLGALEHRDVPFEPLALELQREGRRGTTPLYRCVLTMQDAMADELRLPGITAKPLDVELGATKFDLTMLPTDRTGGLDLALWYRTDLFDQATATRFLDHYVRVLESAALVPGTPVARIPLLSNAERDELQSWNDTARDLGSPTTLYALISAAAARYPDRAALVVGEESVTYRELLARARLLGDRLRVLGVGPGVTVGLCLERGTDAIAAVLGIWDAGGAYVPILPDQPAARLATCLRTSEARVVVTRSAHRGLLPSDATILDLDADDATSEPVGGNGPPIALDPDHLAYVLFTSGSTGEPKGVAVTQRNLLHYVRAVSSVLGIDGKEGWHSATVSTLAADLGHTALFPPLVAGGTVHLLPNDVTTDASRFQAYLEQHPVDLLKITPGHFAALAGARPAAAHLPHRWLVLGGEACPWSLVEAVRAVGRCRVLNHYGPTEATVGVCVFEPGSRDVSAWAPATVPIGRPLPNATAHVLDAAGELCPVGVPGELWLGGAGIARGYVGRDDLTSERFVRRNGERLYRTGDRVRRLPTGDLEFLGRLDTQVKIRGYRVELGEIEALVAAQPGVQQAAVMLRGDELVGYLVAGPECTDSVLGSALGARLPDYMVPSAWVRLDRLPLNPNGKVDRVALPAPSPVAAAGDGAPTSDVERRLALLWADVLKKPSVGIHENFFALGGHSLLAIRLLGRIARTFGARLPLRTLFDHPTVAELARVLEPSSPTEETLRSLWAEVLKREKVGREQNFFELGGHSLLAIRLLGRIAKTFGVRLPLRALFDHPTVAALAGRLDLEAKGPPADPASQGPA